MTTNLPIKSLDFEQIKKDFKEFLKANPTYKDFNFEASGISSLLDILAYNTHMQGFHTKMLMDEAFIDSAHTRQALLSHAKRTGYVPRGRRSARADVSISILVETMPETMSITIPRGTTFTSTNNTQDRRNFYNIDDVILQDYVNVVEDGINKIKFTSPEFTIYEGSQESYRFIVDSMDISQKFVIRDTNIDIDTLRVNVYDAVGSNTVREFHRAEDVLELTSNTDVFFITTDKDGFYQIFFGDGTFGKKLDNGNMISASYISSNGESGNGAKTFLYAPSQGNFDDHETTTLSISSGGMEEESVDSLRFTIPHHYRRQNRIVTESDYHSVLLSEFRNIDSINVWGGEKNGRKEYGKVFVSIKPKNADALTVSARNEIKNSVIQKYGVVGVEVIFVDPDFIDVDVSIRAKVDFKKTNRNKGQIENLIISRTKEYNDNNLNVFGNLLSDISMLDYIRDVDGAFISLYSNKILRKKYKVLHKSTSTHEVNFANPIQNGVKSSEFKYGGNNCYLKDENGLIYIYKSQDNKKLLEKSFGQVVYSTGKIEFTLPTAAVMVGYEGESIGLIEFTVTPVSPDIETNLNNIVRISAVRAIVL